MHLDLTRPTFVIGGSWNPAIFAPPWFAQHMLGIPAGTEINANVVQKSGDPRQIFYIGDIGYFASNSRLELYLNNLDPKNLQLAESIVQQLIATLPFTPIFALGVNFFFQVQNPDDEVFDLLDTKDQINQHFKILQQSFIANIDYKPSIQLNFTRVPENSIISFDFNYHHFVSIERILEFATSAHVTELFEDSVETLRKLYKLQNYDVVGHELQQ